VEMASIGAAAAVQWRGWWHQYCKVAAWQHDGGDMRMREYKVCNYGTDNEDLVSFEL
jgi:hypothetical protein